MQNEYIAHHGTKGQKWGRRLYQNADGSLTPLGRLRYGSGDGRTKSGNSTATKSQNGSTKPTQSTSTTTTSEKQNYSSKARAKNIDEMSDTELQSYINRIRLEQSYNQLTSTPPQQKKVNKGVEFVKEVAYNAGKQVATDMVKQGLTYVTANTLNKTLFDGKKVFDNKYKEPQDKKKD